MQSRVEQILSLGNDGPFSEKNYPPVAEGHVCPHFAYLAELANLFFGIDPQVLRHCHRFCGSYNDRSYANDGGGSNVPVTLCLRLHDAIVHAIGDVKFAIANTKIVDGVRRMVLIVPNDLRPNSHTTPEESISFETDTIISGLRVIANFRRDLVATDETYLEGMEHELVEMESILIHKGVPGGIYSFVPRDKCPIAPQPE